MLYRYRIIDYDKSYDLHLVSCIFELNIQPCVHHHAVSVVLCCVSTKQKRKKTKVECLIWVFFPFIHF
ncbi:hypothetical protein GLYMA_06G240800v4 [Glycine max]|uniref:Uncharacterized protein n=1 Tax=Glycine max TaxID=3847 RepID=A0A0R0JL64_SOYBN|nr:hypothetical protein JHK85_016722 [Glycine max]KAH1127387.1 hypothetical protein GYH30_016109 [Glycine max]KRH55258.1 hypothetical protein GLYMA_06G240800v4 [Glycine max]